VQNSAPKDLAANSDGAVMVTLKIARFDHHIGTVFFRPALRRRHEF
jgi:hypothetical protein